jgi:hypothetical protein
MELDVRFDNQSVSIPIENAFRLDLDKIVGRVEELLASRGANLNDHDVRGLLPRMVKGIAGCEAGCPADAKSVVQKGHQNFRLEYIEGGILSATVDIVPGKPLSLKLFPDF